MKFSIKAVLALSHDQATETINAAVLERDIPGLENAIQTGIVLFMRPENKHYSWLWIDTPTSRETGAARSRTMATIINSRHTDYSPRWSGMGNGDHWVVPVKGTPYGSLGTVTLACTDATGHGRYDRDAALLCGDEAAAREVASLMDSRRPAREVEAAARRGREEYDARKAAERQRFGRLNALRNTFGYQSVEDLGRWGVFCDALEDAGFLQEAQEERRKLAQAAADLYRDCRPSETVGFYLLDINPYHYNCGHYPEFVVRATKHQHLAKFTALGEALRAAAERNARSKRDWHSFLNS